MFPEHLVASSVGAPRIELGSRAPEARILPLYYAPTEETTPKRAYYLCYYTPIGYSILSAHTTFALALSPEICGRYRTRTCDPTRVKGVLYQLS